MPLDLGDLDEYFDGGMYATINGKRYRFPPVSGELGLWCKQSSVLKSVLFSDSSAAELERVAKEVGDPPLSDGQTMEQALLSAEAYAQLLADGVSHEAIKHLAATAYARVVGGDGLALAFAHDEDPKANREQRRAAAKPAKKASSSRTTSTAKAATTRKAASGNATGSRKTSAASAKASRGRKS